MHVFFHVWQQAELSCEECCCYRRRDISYTKATAVPFFRCNSSLPSRCLCLVRVQPRHQPHLLCDDDCKRQQRAGAARCYRGAVRPTALDAASAAVAAAAATAGIALGSSSSSCSAAPIYCILMTARRSGRTASQ